MILFLMMSIWTCYDFIMHDRMFLLIYYGSFYSIYPINVQKTCICHLISYTDDDRIQQDLVKIIMV